MANILVSLKEPITAPDGEEYKAVWGMEEHAVIDGFLIVGNIGLIKSNVLSIEQCEEKPLKMIQPGVQTKTYFIPEGEPSLSLIPNIYYSE